MLGKLVAAGNVLGVGEEVAAWNVFGVAAWNVLGVGEGVDV